MDRFELLHSKHNTEFTQRLQKNKNVFYEIYKACGNRFWKPCGSYLFDGQTYDYCEAMYEKQELLYKVAKKASNVLEVGTYMGHSLLIMLLANPTLKITCVDISDEYARPAVAVLNRHFNNAITFLHGPSHEVLMKLRSDGNKYDLFHIDGQHEVDYVRNELEECVRMSDSPDNVVRIVFDDQECLNSLQKEFDTRYRVLSKEIPKCSWSNAYYEIKQNN